MLGESELCLFLVASNQPASMMFDSDQMAEYLAARPSPALFALIRFRLGSHRLRFKIGRLLLVLIGECIGRHCNMNAVEDEQHFLFVQPVYEGVRQQRTVCYDSDQGSIRHFLERNADQMSLAAHYIYLCFQARMSDKSYLAAQPGLYS